VSFQQPPDGVVDVDLGPGLQAITEALDRTTPVGRWCRS